MTDRSGCDTDIAGRNTFRRCRRVANRRSIECLTGWRRLAAIAVLCGLIASVHIPMVFLQVFAWASMTVDFHAENGSWGQSVRMSLSGENLCHVCVHVRETALEAEHGEGTESQIANDHRPGALLLLPVSTVNDEVMPPRSGIERAAIRETTPPGFISPTASPPPRLRSGA